MVLSTSSPISGEAAELFVFSDVGSKIVLPSPSLLFKGDYERDGPDLLVSLDGDQTVRVVDYFTHADAPALYAPDGTTLKGSVVESLAGPLAPGQYAQSGAVATGEAIGQVEELAGSATVQRADGTTETLQVGSKVFENDVVQTADGSKLSLTFVDGTIFTLASASRMILDELIYDPNSTENSGIFNLVEGSFVFIAGQAAKTGGLEINTPAATMGIRGTTVRVDIITVDGKTVVEVSLNRDPDGETGIFTLTDLNGNEIATIDSTETKWIVSPVDGETREIDRSSTDLDSDQVLITDAVNAFQSATQRVQQGGNFVENSGPAEQQDGNEGEQDATPDDGGLDAAPNGDLPNDAPSDEQLDNGGEEQDQGQLDSGGIEVDLASFDGDDLDTSVDIPELESDDVEVDGFNVDATEASLDGAQQEEETQETVAEDDIETGDLPIDIVEGEDSALSIDLPTLTTSVAEDGSIGISGFSINGPSGATAVVTLVAGSTVTLAPNSGVNILAGTGIEDETVQFEGTLEQINAALNGDGTGPSLVYAPSPNADDTGTLDITVEVNGETVSARLDIDILPQQDAPTAVDDAFNVGENGALVVGNLLDNDSDPDTNPSPDVLSVVDAFVGGAQIAFGVATTLPFGGTFVLNANGSYSFDPGNDFDALAAGATAAQTINYQLTDGNGNFDNAVLNITVTGANDLPIVSALTVTTEENITASGQLVASDVDAGDTLTFSLGGAPANGSVVVNADGSFTFTPNADFNGTDSFGFTVDDGNGGTATETVTVTVNAVNDLPTASNVPSDISVIESTPSNLDFSGIAISDIDSATIAVTLTTDAGTFTNVADGSAVGAGVSVAIDLFNGLFISLIGSPADITTYLNDPTNLTYLAPTGVTGQDVATITVTADDGDDSGPVDLGTVNIDVTDVNFAPVVSGLPSDVSVVEDTISNIAVNTISLSDADGDALTVTLSVDSGTFQTPGTGTGVVANLVNPTTITLVGSASDLVNFLESVSNIQYTGALDANGDNAAELTVSVSDGIAAPVINTVNIDITAVNDPPTVSNLATSFVFNEDEASNLDLSAATFVDVEGDNLTITLSVDAGTFATPASGASVGAGVTAVLTDPTTITLSGAGADINTYLDTAANIQYTGPLNVNGNNAAELTISVSDGIAAPVVNTANINLTADNDDPTITGLPSDVSVASSVASAVDLTGFTLADVDSADHIVTITVDTGIFTTVAAGSVISPNLTVNLSTANFQTISLIGTPADINAYLNTSGLITYTPPAGASGDDLALITVFANDGDGSGAIQLGTVNIDVAGNASPVVTNVPSDITVAEDVLTNINLSTIEFDDVEGDSLTVTLAVDNGTFAAPGAAGAMSGVVVAQISPTSISIEGSAANIEAYLDTVANIQYQGDLNTNGDDAAVLTLTVTDGISTAVTDTINIDITAVNDAPVFNTGSVPSTLTVNEDAFTFLSGLSVGDVDAGTSDLTVTLQSTNGFFTIDETVSGGLVSSQVTNNGTGSVTLVGTASEINATFALAGGVTGIRFQGNQDVNGAGTITFTVDDGGATGTGGAMNDSVVINTNILPVNDPTTVTGLPTDVSVAENTVSNVDLSSIVLADVDGDQLDVTISTDTGTFSTPASGAGVGAGVNAQLVSGDIILTGSADDINTYLDTLTNITLQTPLGTTGDNVGLLTITADDGSGAITLGTVNIDVPVVNAAPSFNLDGLTQSELVTNGDFEDLSAGFSTGANLVSPGDGTIPGFTVINAPSRVLVGTNLGGGSGNAAIGLGGSPTGGSASTIQTTIETIVGRTYEITLNTSDPAGVTGNVAFVFVDTAAGENQTLSANSNPVTLRFVADSTTTTVGVQAQLPTTNGLIIDNISVSEVRPDNTFIAQEGASTSLEGIVIDDDSTTSNFTVTLSVTNGTLSDANASSPLTIAGSGTNTLTLTGTLADINSELDGGFVTFDGPAGFRGLDTLTISANDNDAGGIGGAQTFTQTVDVVVGNTSSIIVGTEGADNNIGTGADDIIFGFDSGGGTNVGNFLNGNDVYIGGDGAEDVDGQAGDDFIFGGGGNDFLNGFTGNDTLSGGAGDDTLMDLAADIGTYDGGTGQDTFLITNAGTTDLTAIANSAFTSIETINISNSGSAATANILTLDETDILDLSETSNTTLEGILGSMLPESILIVADANDVVNFELNGPASFTYNFGTATGGFTIVEVRDTELNDLVATVGVSDVATVNLIPANSAPVVTTSAVTTAYFENDPAVVVNNTLVVSDADGDMITGATVSISLQSNGLFEDGDILNFTDTGTITGSYDDTTGVLTLTGTDTAANYQAALRSITFESTRDDLNDLLRDVDFVVNDGTVDSAIVSSVVNPTSVNDAPLIDTSGIVGLDIVTNGSFETPVIGSGSVLLPFGSTSIAGFTVGDGANAATGTGNVDIVDAGFINAADGSQAIDLDGDTPGSITTTLTTEIGTTYEVSFQFAGNPSTDNGVRSANVVVGNQTQTINFDTAGFTNANLVFQTQTITFTAISAATELTFASLSPVGSGAGILIDDVTVREVSSTGIGVDLGSSFTFSNLVFEDPDGDPNNATVILEVTNGTLTLGAASTAGISVGGDGTGTLTLNGALSTINTFFESDDALTYANTSGAAGDVDNLSITVNDGGGFGSGVAQTETTSIPISLGATTFSATTGPDVLTGGAAADVIDGLAGNDTISGGGGNDLLVGGDGADVLNGGEGDDFLRANAGADSLFGDAGNDTLQSLSSFGIDVILDGGAGDDSIFVDDFATLDIQGGTGRDELRFFQSGNIDLRGLASGVGDIIDGVEALSIENGEINNLFLDLATLQGLSPDSDTDLEVLLDTTLTVGRTILGDAGDVLDVEVGAGFTFTQNVALSDNLQDENGNQLDVFEFVETATGNVFATVAVEEQVSVVTS